MKDGCFIFPPYRCSQCLNISNLTGDRTLGMRRLQKVANDIRHLLDQHSCIRVNPTGMCTRGLIAAARVHLIILEVCAHVVSLFVRACL